MNKERIAGMQGKRVKIRPIARRLKATGQELPPIDCWWVIEKVAREVIRLFNPHSYHFAEFGTDHIREFQTDPEGSDGILILKSLVILKGASVHIEPLGVGDPLERYLAT